ncbi:MAG: hypothetical protein Q8P07_05865 [bacterium]|nr:hypothetical protein [bacterium]
MKGLKNLYLKITFFLFSAAILISAVRAGAAGLVPCVDAPCTPCDLWPLAKNIVWFVLFQLAIPVLTVALLVGGVMILISAGNQSLREKGKALIWNGVIGILIAFTAYLVINTIIATIANNKFTAAWMDIEGCPEVGASSQGCGGGAPCGVNMVCENGACVMGGATSCGTGPACTPPQTCQNGTCVTSGSPTLTEAEARKQLADAGITDADIKSTGNCSDKTKSNCTSLDGMQQSTINEMIAFKNACTGCAMTITGGTEVGHEAGACSHSNGCKFDMGKNTKVDSYITTHYTPIVPPSFGTSQYRAPDGYIYTNEGNHWDVGR